MLHKPSVCRYSITTYSTLFGRVTDVSVFITFWLWLASINEPLLDLPEL